MKIINTIPPNYQTILTFLTPRKGTVYCYGDTIYNPESIQIPEDIIYHESIHSRQQKNYGTAELWWTQYLLDPEFRKAQEVEAYAHQLQFIRKHTSSNIAKAALEEMALNLASPMYNVGLTYQQAFTKIRRFMV